ncbi:dipeptide ABC transporter ATP-binding protein [Vogesella sp. LYT5W]|uniref:Dipeptide ABC transporter ATP-binding protein n=1 Tax=Vogesella margarita TaxID=2984199 RepID=A0ABT5IKP6_9NEIS|nr:dipeptide ABC transporter ATP-binding protein [Vogesella margarita]MDC7712791.1 dipeptide ABC transporter ATP-binding protein [Vogesella margarita]
MNPAPPLLSVRKLRVSFRDEHGHGAEAVKGISFDIPAGKTVALVGESGSGKSVTAMAITRLLPEHGCHIDPDSEILFGGRNLLTASRSELRSLRGGDIAMVFQEPMSSLNPVFSVGEQIIETLMLHTGVGRKAAQQRALALMQEVGLPAPERKMRSYPHQLSGGQQQRVMIAMAIACEPKLLIADEPTTALDVTIQQQILQLLASLQQKHGMAVLFISHDLELVGQFADEVIVMHHGSIHEHAPVRQIFEAPQDAYTKALLRCRPHLASRPAKLPVIRDFLGDSCYFEPPQRQRGYQTDDRVILEVQGLSVDYHSRHGWFGHHSQRAVDGVSFTLMRGRTLGIVGESGSGKSTLGLALIRLQQASAGRVLFEGEDMLALTPRQLRDYKRRIQIVFQNPYASLNPRFSVAQILTEPMLLHGIGCDTAERLQLAGDWLEHVGLPRKALAKYPHEFSGGQRQRIAIARCLTMHPEILICDESVSALDVSVQAQVLNLLQALQDELGLSYLFISHDLAVVKHLSDQVLVMQQGRCVELADADTLYAAPQHPYTRQLLDAIPQGWPHCIRPRPA